MNSLLTVGGDKLMADPRRSCGPMEECRRIGNPLPPGVPPDDTEKYVFIHEYLNRN